MGKLALIQNRQAVEDIWIRQVNEELDIEKLKRNTATIFHDTVANRPIRKKGQMKRFQAGGEKK